MKAITAVGATPQRMEVLYTILREAGVDGEERERLGNLLGPASLAKDQADPGEDNALVDCLSLGHEMGLIREENGRVSLTMIEGPSSFLDIAGRQMVDQVTSSVPTEGWVAGAVAWMLRQDPRNPLPWKDSGAATRLQSQLGSPPPFGLTNDSRIQQAVYWARALGFVTRWNIAKQEVIVSDPTEAVSQRLNNLLPRGQQITMPVFLASLGRACPVLDGGSVHREVVTRASQTLNANKISGSLSLALLRLKQRGELQFHYFDDAEVVEAEGLLADGRVTHISRLQVSA